MLFSFAFMTPIQAKEIISSTSCVKLVQINLSEHELLNSFQQQRMFKPYMGRCIDGKLLKSMISDVSSFYMRRGHITSQAYLRKQSVTDGQIEITILTGRIEDVIDAETGVSNARINTAFAFQQGEALNLRDLETSLEMMNRVPSSDVKFKIKPGSEQGVSIVEINTTDITPYHLTVGLSGQNALVDKNIYFTAHASVDNLFNINDIFTIRYNGSKEQREYQANNGGELNYSFPIASYLTEMVWSNFTYRQGVNGLNDTYLSKGETEGLRLKISKILSRDQQNKFKGSVSIYHKTTKNYFSDSLIDVSSYKTTLAQVDLSHSYVRDWGRLTSTYSYYQGTDWFGARDDAYFNALNTASEASLQFTKHTLDLNLLFRFKGSDYQWASNFYVQGSGDLLYDNDKLTVGSDYTVRGYSSPSLYGNNAWYIKNDLSKAWHAQMDTELLQSISPFIGLDYGQVRCESDNQGSCGDVSGFSLGFTTQGKHLSSSFVWSQPLVKISSNFRVKNLLKYDMTWTY